MSDYRQKIDELISWTRTLRGCPNFDDVRMLDGRAVIKGKAPRAAMQSVDDFEGRYGELRNRNLPWINLHAAGLHEGALVVVVETPADSTANRESTTAVNTSGPSAAVAADPGWDLAASLVIE